MIVLITGIYGFLGSCLAEKLAGKHHVIGLYHVNTKSIDSSITVYDSLEEINTTPDVIVLCHAAVSSGSHQENSDVLHNANVHFTQKIINKFPTTKLIYISSVSVYSNDGSIVTERSTDNPQKPYAQSKLAAEKLVMKHPGNYVIRLSSLYGKGMKENTLIPNYANQALQSKNISVWGNGGRYQNYIYIEDAISFIEKSIDCKSMINFPLLGVADKEYTNAEVAAIIAELTGAEIVYTGEDKALSYHYSNVLTQNTLGWSAATTLADGLKEYIEWKEKQY
ncbi:MAG: NAD(P)-dependent oxidoreductase [Sphingobacteriaceae bacterium]|nr:MAG: NAD(P)-dependent oxidoreductase [Sphingobacteriaceae bacterium]